MLAFMVNFYTEANPGQNLLLTFVDLGLVYALSEDVAWNLMDKQDNKHSCAL